MLFLLLLGAKTLRLAHLFIVYKDTNLDSVLHCCSHLYHCFTAFLNFSSRQIPHYVLPCLWNANTWMPKKKNVSFYSWRKVPGVSFASFITSHRCKRGRFWMDWLEQVRRLAWTSPGEACILGAALLVTVRAVARIHKGNSRKPWIQNSDRIF